MLPSLKKSQATISEQQQQTSRLLSLKKSSISSAKIAKQIEQIISYQDRYQQQLEINIKLKKHLSNIRSNNQTSTIVKQEQNQVTLLTKQKRRLQNEAQHQAHSLNILISQNNKLKSQVDTERNKRAIYFNVYKNLQHQIHDWQSKYKNVLIQTMKSEGAIIKVQQKFRKATKKVQRDVQNLKQQIERLENLQEQQNINTINTDLQVKPPKTKNIKQQKIKCLKQNNKNTNMVFLTVTQNNNLQKSLHHSPSVHQNRKSIDPELQFQIQQKNIELQGLLARIRQICGQNDISQCCNQYNSIQQDIQYNFTLFKSEEKRDKQLKQKIDTLENEIKLLQNQNTQRKSTKKIKDNQAQSQIDKLQQKIRQLEAKLQDKIGVKVENLTNQMILHHCLRLRQQKKGKKNLEKYLQQTKKQKPEYNTLLTPKQMYKNLIQHQASLN